MLGLEGRSRNIRGLIQVPDTGFFEHKREKEKKKEAKQ